MATMRSAISEGLCRRDDPRLEFEICDRGQASRSPDIRSVVIRTTHVIAARAADQLAAMTRKPLSAIGTNVAVVLGRHLRT